MSQPQPVPSASQPCLTMIDVEKFSATSLSTNPFDYIIVPGFVQSQAFDQVIAAYPPIDKGGSFPLHLLKYGPAFQRLLDELQGPEFRQAVEKKFSVDLTGKPTMITVRGVCSKRDGKVHTDTESKILSLLLYMNPAWEKEGGRLRLLRSDNIEDVATEVPPVAGTLLVFRRADNSFHGHKMHVGARKVIQMNWVTDQKFIDHSMKRHGISAFIKRFNPFSGDY